MMNQYSEKQILCGIRECWKVMMGTDQPFVAETRIDLHMQLCDVWEDVDLGDVFYWLGRFFGFECPLEEWTEGLGIAGPINSIEEWERDIAPGFTFGAVARFIQARVTSTNSFEPVTIISRECRPAGVFYGIRQVSEEVFESVCSPHRFGPSTKIIDVFRGRKLDRFWKKLRWMTEYGIPELPSKWQNVEGWACLAGYLGILVVIPISMLSQNYWYLIAMIACAVIAWFGSSLYKHWENPIPPELQTFRDLAVLIAKHDCDAVRKS